MLKASTPSLEKFMKPYLSTDEFGACITDENAKKALNDVFSEFENVYCGISEEKQVLECSSLNLLKPEKLSAKSE